MHLGLFEILSFTQFCNTPKRAPYTATHTEMRSKLLITTPCTVLHSELCYTLTCTPQYTALQLSHLSLHNLLDCTTHCTLLYTELNTTLQCTLHCSALQTSLQGTTPCSGALHYTLQLNIPLSEYCAQ